MKDIFIQNYKNIDQLHIGGLERINLFTGKNNTGKSSLLEAIALFVNKGNLNVIRQILQDRGESLSNDKFEKNDNLLNSLASLFTDRIIDFSKESSIVIGPKGREEKSLSIRFVRYTDYKSSDIETVKRSVLEDNPNIIEDGNAEIGLQIKIDGKQKVIPFQSNMFGNFYYQNIVAESLDNFQYIKHTSSTTEENVRLWDKIALTEKEDFVIEGLRVIEPNIERIGFVGDLANERSAIIKLKGNKSILPLKGMGDGINRMLSVILAAVNAGGGCLLIDEFENGLHYTVQEKMWEILFKLSHQLNIQVFVTTHSNDCIVGFEEILSENMNEITGKLFRLEKKGGKIKNVSFTSKELEIATKEEIETR